MSTGSLGDVSDRGEGFLWGENRRGRGWGGSVGRLETK